MSTPAAARGVAKIVLFALLTLLLSFYFGLGYVLPFVWLFGSVGVLLLTTPELRRVSHRLTAGTFVVILYTAALVGLGYVLFDHVKEETFLVRVDAFTIPESGEREVTVRFVEHPNHLYIKQFAAGETDPLLTTAESDAGPVEATVFITRDLGCVRGSHLGSVAGVPVDNRGVQFQRQGERMMFSRPWWCP